MDPNRFPSQPLLPQLPNVPSSVPESPRTHLRPTYSDAFQCVASACEDTCCRGWSVPIDQATYERYRSHRAIKPFVSKLIVLNTASPSTSDYARMPLTTDGTCGFLDSDLLCGIHKNLGAEMLSVTCATYPRAIQPDPIRLAPSEVALNLSCPEAARLVLLHPALLRPEQCSTLAGSLQIPPAYLRLQQEDGVHFRSGEARLAIRDFVLTLLGDRRYPIWQRLYLLGPLVRQLKKLARVHPSSELSLASWCDASPVLVAHILADSARTAAGLRLKPVMDELEARPAEQLQLVMEILRMRLAEPPTPGRFVECIAEFELGLETTTARNEQQILDAYASGQRYLNALLEEHPQLIENYLLNHIFKNSFPFGRQSLRFSGKPVPAPDPEHEHTYLCILATLAQTMLTGIAAHHRERFGVAHVLKLIQSLARAIEHGTSFPARLAEYVQQRGPEAILIRSLADPPHRMPRGRDPVSLPPSPARLPPSPADLPRRFQSPSHPARSAP